MGLCYFPLFSSGCVAVGAAALLYIYCHFSLFSSLPLILSFIQMKTVWQQTKKLTVILLRQHQQKIHNHKQAAPPSVACAVIMAFPMSFFGAKFANSDPNTGN